MSESNFVNLTAANPFDPAAARPIFRRWAGSEEASDHNPGA
jgi:hypothetical protein